jgi:hypothetical protein
MLRHCRIPGWRDLFWALIHTTAGSLWSGTRSEFWTPAGVARKEFLFIFKRDVGEFLFIFIHQQALIHTTARLVYGEFLFILYIYERIFVQRCYKAPRAKEKGRNISYEISSLHKLNSLLIFCLALMQTRPSSSLNASFQVCKFALLLSKTTSFLTVTCNFHNGVGAHPLSHHSVYSGKKKHLDPDFKTMGTDFGAL